jgi:hypothetical protein
MHTKRPEIAGDIRRRPGESLASSVTDGDSIATAGYLRRMVGWLVLTWCCHHHACEPVHALGRRVGLVGPVITARPVGTEAEPDRASAKGTAAHHHIRACCQVLAVLAVLVVLAVLRRLRFGSPRLWRRHARPGR